MDFSELEKILLDRVANQPQPKNVLKSPEITELYRAIKDQAPEERAAFGQKVNSLKQKLEQAILDREKASLVDDRPRLPQRGRAPRTDPRLRHGERRASVRLRVAR